MIIDCHGHYTTSPPQHEAWRVQQIAALKDGHMPPARPNISDDEIRESIETGQLRIQRERGTDLTIFSPRAAGMGGGAYFIGHQLVNSPEVSIDRHKNPYPWNTVQQWQSPKLFNYHKEFFENRRNLSDEKLY